MRKLPIHQVIFSTQRQMNLAVGRVSQFSADPELQGRVFTLERMIEVDRRLRKVSPRAAGYLDYWDGHNLSKQDFKRFLKAGFKDISREESALLSIVRRLPADAQVVATFGKNDHILAHEIVHGLYDHWPKYRREVNAAIRRHRAPRIRRALVKMGYLSSTYPTEINAYLTTGVESSLRMFGPDERKLRTELDLLLRKHLGHGFMFKDKKTGLERVLKLIHVIRFPLAA